MKRSFKKLIRLLGYDIAINRSHVYDLDMYSDIYGPDSVGKEKFYNVGAGLFFHPVWINIDNYDAQSPKQKPIPNRIKYDLLSLEPLPIETDSAEIVYSGHTIEHITDEAAQNVFTEVHRILKKGGFFRVVTPNIDLFYRAYLEKDRYFFCWKDWYSTPEIIKKNELIKPMNTATIGELFLYQFAASISPLHADGSGERIDDDALENIFSELDFETALDYCTAQCPLDIQKKYPFNHINWWNADKVFRMLRKAGFNSMYLSGYGQSLSPVLRNLNFFDSRPKISLYIEAVK